MSAAVLFLRILMVPLLIICGGSDGGSPVVEDWDGPEVHTRYGKVHGVVTSSSNNYYGIPYALPPVKQLRWKEPQNPSPWINMTLDARSFKPGCPQPLELCPLPAMCPRVASEDCLYLNVFTPLPLHHPPTNQNWPVMVYIHGGAFQLGGGGVPMYDGRHLVHVGDVVVVTFNYRLGVLGFLVTGNGKYDAKGNYGILDQQAALKWVQENIGNFGGNPSLVTIFGDSAGAQSVLLHLSLPYSERLFHRAIVQSSPIAIPYFSRSQAGALGAVLSEMAGCIPRDVECLGWKTPEQLVDAGINASRNFLPVFDVRNAEPWGPTVDGHLIKATHLELIRKGIYTAKPLLIGTTTEEVAPVVYAVFDQPLSTLIYQLILQSGLTFLPPSALDVYLPLNTDDQRPQSIAQGTDSLFICPARNLSRMILSQDRTRVWMYVWDYVMPYLRELCHNCVCHGADTLFRFHTFSQLNIHVTPDERTLSIALMTHWTNFAKFGDPNIARDKADSIFVEEVKKFSMWFPYTEDNGWPVYRYRLTGGHVLRHFRQKYCNFWDSVGYDFLLD